MITVRPSRHSSAKKSRTCSRVSGSRLPVGSSARMTAGSFASVRARATRCCWPTLSSLGLWSSRPSRPTRAKSAAARSLVLERVRTREHQRDLHVFERGQVRNQIERLKHEADASLPDLGALVGRGIVERAIVEPDFAAGRREHAAQHREQRRLAAAAGADDGDELARAISSVVGLQGDHRRILVTVAFRNMLRVETWFIPPGSKDRDRSSSRAGPADSWPRARRPPPRAPRSAPATARARRRCRPDSAPSRRRAPCRPRSRSRRPPGR